MKTLETKEFIEKIKDGSVGVRYGYRGNYDPNIEEINGQRGANSDGLLGKEVNPKIFYAHGIDGALQIFNRNVNLVFQSSIQFLSDDVHKQYFPSTVETDIENGNPDRNLTPMEAIEYARRYLDSFVTYAFDERMTQYENPELTDERLSEIEAKIESYEAVPAFSDGTIISVEEGKNGGPAEIRLQKQTPENSKPVVLRDLIKSLDAQMEIFYAQGATDLNPEFGIIKAKRGELSMMLRKVATEMLRDSLGNVVSDGNVERYIFNEDKIRLIDIEKNPHNCYTAQELTEDGRLVARPIGEKDGLTVVTSGGKPAKYLDVITDLHSSYQGDRPTIKGDIDFIGMLGEYNGLVKGAKEKHLIKDIEGGPDIKNLSFYGEAFIDFEKRLEEFSKGVRRMDPLDSAANRPLPRINIEDGIKVRKSSEELIKDVMTNDKVVGFIDQAAGNLLNVIRAERDGSIKTSDDDVGKGQV